MIDIKVIDMQRHPEHMPNEKGYRNDSWAIKFRVSYNGESKTFWRWHSSSREGLSKDELTPKPDAWTVVEKFWKETFQGMSGFDFKKGD